MKEKYNCNLKVKCFYRLDALDFASGHQNLVCYKVNNMNNAHGVLSIARLKPQTLKKHDFFFDYGKSFFGPKKEKEHTFKK